MYFNRMFYKIYNFSESKCIKCILQVKKSFRNFWHIIGCSSPVVIGEIIEERMYRSLVRLIRRDEQTFPSAPGVSLQANEAKTGARGLSTHTSAFIFLPLVSGQVQLYPGKFVLKFLQHNQLEFVIVQTERVVQRFERFEDCNICTLFDIILLLP